MAASAPGAARSPQGPLGVRRPLALCFVLALLSQPTCAASQTLTPTPIGTPKRLELKPLIKTISVGESANYTATGIYDQNGSETPKNLTQKVEYSSSDPTIAEAPNTDGNRGRVDGINPGHVTITATEPISGLTASGELTVQGALVGLALKPEEKIADVGDIVTYTATGILSDGNTRNMTQKVVYSSSDPTVAVCPNVEGNQSEVHAVGPGTAIISALDPVSLIETEQEGSSTLTVRSPSTPTPPASYPTPTPSPPNLTKAERGCQSTVASQTSKFTTVLLTQFQKCLDRALRDLPIPDRASGVASGCVQALNPQLPGSLVARARARATAQIVKKCAGLSPADLGNTCNGGSSTIASFSECTLERHAVAAQNMIAAQYGHACSLLTAVGLHSAYPLVCVQQ